MNPALLITKKFIEVRKGWVKWTFMGGFLLSLLAYPNAFGREIRIVSLVPSITEILFGIGLDEKAIVGITDYSDYPPQTEKILKVGSFTTINIERVVSLRPDYVFSIGNEFSPLNTQLKKAGLNVITFNPQGIQDILSNILEIGVILNRKEAAAAVVKQMREDLAKIRHKTEIAENKKKVYIEIWDDPITSCGKGSLLDEVITAAGGINITGDIKTAYPTISQELIIKENPDIIILGYMGREQKSAIKALYNRFGWQAIAAVKNKKIIYDIEPSLFLKPGPRIVKGIEEIHKRIYEAQ